MTREDAQEMLQRMNTEFTSADHCPQCGVPEDSEHLRNCLWAKQYRQLEDFIERSVPIPPLDGPNLLFGEPCGTYELGAAAGVWFFKYRTGGTEITIPLTTVALVELRGLLNMVALPVVLEKVNGRPGHC